VGSSGCTSQPVSIAINEIPFPIPVLTLGGNDTFCLGQSVVLYASGGTNYQWNNSVRSDSILVANSRSEVFFTAFNGPNNLCSVNSDTVRITMLPEPAVWYSVISPFNKCLGDTAFFTVQAQAGIQYQWYLDTLPVVGANTNAYSGIGTGDLYFIATDSFGCQKTSAISQIIDDMPAKPTVGVVADIFLGTTSPTHMYAYRWTVNDSLLYSLNYMQANIKPPVNGSYRVFVYSKTGCSVGSDPFNFTWVSNESQLYMPEWKVYPNPSQNYLIVESPVESAIAQFIDVQGKTVISQNLNFGNNQFELSNLSSGVYQLVIKSGEYLGNYKIQVLH
jgi:hypothetical protein